MKKVKILGIVAVLLIAAMSLTGCGSTPEAGKLGVVRNGGPVDNHNIRQIVKPGQGYTWVGMFSTVHYYPTDSVQRIYTITSDKARGDRTGVDVVNVPSEDGINMGLEGTFYLKTTFNGTADGIKDAKSYDNKFGVRTFRDANTKAQLHAWEGDEGWEAFLDAIVRPVIDNALRQAVGGERCEELIASCALVQHSSVDNTDLSKVVTNNHTSANINKIQDQINADLQDELNKTLGGHYFGDIHFTLQRVTLPPNVQNAINDTQASYAGLSKAQAQVTKAELENEANAKKAKIYSTCKICGEIDLVTALRSNGKGQAPINLYYGLGDNITIPAK